MTCGPSIIPTIQFEPPKEENLSTKDMNYGPSIIPTIHFKPPKEENLSTKNKSAEFMPSPKCPLFRGSTVRQKPYYKKAISNDFYTQGISKAYMYTVCVKFSHNFIFTVFSTDYKASAEVYTCKI